MGQQVAARVPQYRVSGETSYWKMSRAAAIDVVLLKDFTMPIRFGPSTELLWNSAYLTVPPRIAGI